jgi:hypothetical protein
MVWRPRLRTARLSGARHCASRRAWLGSLLLPVALLGCDDKKDLPTNPTSAPPPSTQPAAPTATAPARPTTQELVSGKRKVLNLSAYRLTIEVPESWHLDSIGSTTYIIGDAPGGEVRIHLAPGAQIKADPIKAMEKKALAEAQAHPETLEVKALLNIGGSARMMERREIRRNVPIEGEDGKTHNSDRVDWSVMVFLPDGDKFTLELLDFSSMPLQQYQGDKAFLEGIIRSLHYDATGGAL